VKRHHPTIDMVQDGINEVNAAMPINERIMIRHSSMSRRWRIVAERRVKAPGEQVLNRWEFATALASDVTLPEAWSIVCTLTWIVESLRERVKEDLAAANFMAAGGRTK